MESIINQCENYVMHTYNRYPIALAKAKDVYLYDEQGKKYLDFMSGIGVYALGYSNKAYKKALKKQIDQLMHTSNMVYTKALAQASEAITKATGMDKVFFTNSGAEAIEGAIKLARRYAFNKGKTDKAQIISMDHSFHGRTMGAVAVTGTPKYREPFEPLIGGVSFATFNDLESVKALVNENTCAILMETIQGEGGIHPSTLEFIQGVRKLCDENDILMICDEIQCGMGRSGAMFAYENYGVKPDVVTMAKGIGNGFPVGAFAACGKCKDSLVAGDHGTTYGGNPMAMTAVNTVFEQFEEKQIVEHVNVVGSYLEDCLDVFVEKHKDKIVCHRGMGLIQGIECSVDVAPLIKKGLSEGIMLIAAAGNVIRFLPPLNIEKKHIDEMIVILEKIFA